MKNNPIKVLHVIDGFGMGGAETWLLNCVRYLHTNPQLHVQFDFIATGGQPYVFDQIIKSYGSEIFYIKYSLTRFLQFRKEFQSVLKQNHYCAIHSHLDFVTGWQLLFGLGSLPPIRISHLHNPYNFVNNYSISFSRKLSYRIGRFLMSRLATDITGTSNAVMDEYGYNQSPFVEKRIQPLYCGIPVDEFTFDLEKKNKLIESLGWKNQPVALFVGRIGTHDHVKAKNQKNPLFAFEIAKQLIKSHPEWRFLFVGYKGPLGEKMETELKNNNLDDKIKLLGLRNDIHDIFSFADVLLFPSLWEGLGMVAVEAQAAGLIVLMSENVPKEAIVNNDLVRCLSLDKSIDEWVMQLNSGLTRSITQRKLAAQKVKSSMFSIENSVLNMLKAYQKNRE